MTLQRIGLVSVFSWAFAMCLSSATLAEETLRPNNLVGYLVQRVTGAPDDEWCHGSNCVHYSCKESHPDHRCMHVNYIWRARYEEHRTYKPKMGTPGSFLLIDMGPGWTLDETRNIDWCFDIRDDPGNVFGGATGLPLYVFELDGTVWQLVTEDPRTHRALPVVDVFYHKNGKKLRPCPHCHPDWAGTQDPRRGGKGNLQGADTGLNPRGGADLEWRVRLNATVFERGASKPLTPPLASIEDRLLPKEALAR